jgi:pantothenate kinase
MPKTTIRIRNLKHFRRTLTQDLHELFKPECTAAHNAQWAQTKQDIKITTTQTNMERHRSLKHTLLQVEIQKTSQKQLFTHCRSKKKQQRNSQSKTFSQHEKTHFKHTRIYTQIQRGKPKEHQRTLQRKPHHALKQAKHAPHGTYQIQGLTHSALGRYGRFSVRFRL